jgi:hypothetical protein
MLLVPPRVDARHVHPHSQNFKLKVFLPLLISVPTACVLVSIPIASQGALGLGARFLRNEGG